MMNIEITNQEHNLLIACLTVAENEAKKRGDTITQLNVGKLREKISETLFKGGDL